MRRVFADTSFFVAAIGPRDEHHERAVELARGHKGQVITTDFVLVELGNYLYRVKDRLYLESILQNIQANPQYEIIDATRQLMERGIDRYIARPDKDWSLTDCISFVVMEEHGITEALTSDEDFEQAGFRALLR